MVEVPNVDSEYSTGGFGTEIGYGSAPVLLVIDLQKGMTDPDRPRGTDHTEVIEQTSDLVDSAHRNEVPVVFVRGIFRQPDIEKAGMYLERNPALKELTPGSTDVEFDDRLDVRNGDYVLDKRVPSAFHDTELNSVLTHMERDTVVVAGCNTSGCIRASVVDACQHGYYTVVAPECVGDRTDEQHEMSLYEMDLKYADVNPKAEVEEYFQGS
jgi:nicotinamidase-related amidase